MVIILYKFLDLVEPDFFKCKAKINADRKLQYDS